MVNISEISDEPTYGWTIINGHLVRQFNNRGMFRDVRNTIRDISYMEQNPLDPREEVGLLVTLYVPVDLNEEPWSTMLPLFDHPIKTSGPCLRSTIGMARERHKALTSTWSTRNSPTRLCPIERWQRYQEQMSGILESVADKRAHVACKMSQMQAVLEQTLQCPLAHADISMLASRLTVHYTTAPLPESLRGMPVKAEA